MLLRMGDDENKNWAEIREAWTKMTGGEVGKSTLCNRYLRIKANFVVISAEDVSSICLVLVLSIKKKKDVVLTQILKHRRIEFHKLRRALKRSLKWRNGTALPKR